MSAPAVAKKPVQSQSNGQQPDKNLQLMQALHPPAKSYDPMPPDQYLADLDDPEADADHRALAWVRAHTIRFGHRSPFCVDAEGRELGLKHMQADLGWKAPFAARVWRRLTEKGLVRKETRRLYLCGTVTPAAEPEPEPDPDPQVESLQQSCLYRQLSEYVKAQLLKLKPDDRRQCLARIGLIRQFTKSAHSSVVKQVRDAGESLEATVWDHFGIDPGTLPKRVARDYSIVKVTFTHQPDLEFAVRPTSDAVKAGSGSPADSGLSPQLQEQPGKLQPTNTRRSDLPVRRREEGAGSSSQSNGHPPDSMATDRNKAGASKNGAPRVSGAEIAAVGAVMRKYAAVDDSGVELLITRCRERRPNSTPAEICAALELKGKAARTKDSPSGFLIESVPPLLHSHAPVKPAKSRGPDAVDRGPVLSEEELDRFAKEQDRRVKGAGHG